ncbi:MAG: ligase-associated DNA damage response exonuclease [Pseudomonadota bacterium]
MSDRLLTFTTSGIYCPAADVYIDPWRPVDRALITHGHADHARSGMRRYLATEAAAPVMRHRLGEIDLQTTPYGAPIDINGVTFSFHPAGHVPGSAQIRVEHKGDVWLVSGDYKLEEDGISDPFEPVRCNTFITECTFGLPVFNWANPGDVANEINAWWRANTAAGKFSICGAYSLGKAQRILAALDPSIGPILCHGAVEGTNGVLRSQGIALPDTVYVRPELDLKTVPGAFVLAPPSALGSTWAGRFRPASTAFASGWMALRGVRRRRSADRGFVMSDHADWAGLTRAIRETEATRIFVTHGYTSIFQRYLSEAGYNAGIVETEFGDDPEEGE